MSDVSQAVSPVLLAASARHSRMRTVRAHAGSLTPAVKRMFKDGSLPTRTSSSIFVSLRPVALRVGHAAID